LEGVSRIRKFFRGFGKNGLGDFIWPIVIMLAGLVLLMTVPQVRVFTEIARADIEASCGDKVSAIRDYQYALSTDPLNEEALRKLVSLLRDMGRDDDACPYFRRLYANALTRFQAIPYLVTYSLKMHDAQDAFSYADEWVKHDPSSSGAYEARGLAYEQLGKQDEALADFNKSIEINPASGAQADRDYLLQKGREWNRETQTVFDPKLENNHHDYTALVRDARRLFRGYSWAPCEATAAEAIKLRPDLPQAYYVRARMYMEEQKWQKEIADLEVVQRLCGNKILDVPRLDDDSVQFVEARTHVTPASLWFYRGCAQYELKQWKQSRRSLDRALALNNFNFELYRSRIYAMRAVIDKNLGDMAQARIDSSKAADARRKLRPVYEQGDETEWF
jgi:tetratricopeptide (TPR) repeat protein